MNHRYKISPMLFEQRLNQVYAADGLQTPLFKTFSEKMVNLWRPHIQLGAVGRDAMVAFLCEGMAILFEAYLSDGPSVCISEYYDYKYETDENLFVLGKRNNCIGFPGLGRVAACATHHYTFEIGLSSLLMVAVSEKPVYLLCIKALFDIVVPITSDYRLSFGRRGEGAFVLGEHDGAGGCRLGLTTGI